MTYYSPTLIQIQQKLKNIKSLVKKQSQHYNSINNKLTVFKKQQIIILIFFKPKTWIAIISNNSGRQLRFSFYNKQNKRKVKPKNNAFAKKMRKQAPEKITYKIHAYFIENNITITKFCIMRILSSGDVAIQIISIEKVEKLREKNGWTKVLANKIKLI